MLPEHSYDALHAGEAYLVHLFEGTNLRAIHARRKTINQAKGNPLSLLHLQYEGKHFILKKHFFLFLVISSSEH